MCSFGSVKCCFIFFNLLFLASGVNLIIIGVQQHLTYSQMGTFAEHGLIKMTIILIAVGSTTALVSLFGHLGAFFDKHSMVACFISLLIIIIILEILAGAAFYVFCSRTVVLKGAKSTMDFNSRTRRVIHDYNPLKRHTIDRIQEKFKCCGADGPTDWSSSVGWVNHDAVPDSCCVEKSQGCGKNKNKVHKKGCIEAIRIFVLRNLVWVGAVCIVLEVSEVFGVVLGVCLCIKLKKEDYEDIS